MVDLMQYGGVDTFLRIGTSGTQRPDLNVGDIVITSGAVRDEGLTKEYIDACYPAIASYELMLPMIESAQARSLRYHVGITRSNDAIYCGQGRPVMGYLPNEGVVEHWVNAGVLNVERETAAILTLAQLFHARGGSICTVCQQLDHPEGRRIAGDRRCDRRRSGGACTPRQARRGEGKGRAEMVEPALRLMRRQNGKGGPEDGAEDAARRHE